MSLKEQAAAWPQGESRKESVALDVPFLLLTACKAFAYHRAGLLLIKVVYSVGLGPRRRQDSGSSEDKDLLDKLDHNL